MNSEKRLAQVLRSLDAIESGCYHELSLSRCADYLVWMHRYNKISRDRLEPIIDKVTTMFQSGLYE